MRQSQAEHQRDSHNEEVAGRIHVCVLQVGQADGGDDAEHDEEHAAHDRVRDGGEHRANLRENPDENHDHSPTLDNAQTTHLQRGAMRAGSRLCQVSVDLVSLRRIRTKPRYNGTGTSVSTNRELRKNRKRKRPIRIYCK